MASTTLTSSSSASLHPHRASFSSAPGAPIPNSTNLVSHPPPASAPAAPYRERKMSQPSSQQSFVMSQPSQSALAPSSFRQYNESNPRIANDAPQIYSAVYSGVDVYEMEVNGIAVMRRRTDSWLNATQILKVARIDKGKRTKILEKEIQTGEHEKVQGGYGKYQGTWIKFERGVEVCRQYGVEDILRPLLTYDMGQDGGVAGRGDFNTPTKEQAMAAQRKRMYSASQDSRPNGVAGTFFKNISTAASSAVAAISKARFDSPGPRHRNGPGRAPGFPRQTSTQSMDDFQGNSQQSFVSDYAQNVDSAYSTQQQQQQQQQQLLQQQQQHHPQLNGDGPEPPRKRQRVNMTPADSFGYSHSMEMYANAFPGSPTEPNESFIYSQAGINVHDNDQDGIVALPPLPYEVSTDAELKRQELMNLFLPDANTVNPSTLDFLRSLTPLELDMPIDAQSHTALHWAATLSRMPLLRSLIAAGASPYRVNAPGETALMRACVVTNSFDHSSFPELLDVLGGTMEMCDNKGRTVLHHIALTSAVNGRQSASRYYLESLLEWIVRSGSAPNSQNAAGVNGHGLAKMSIGRFMGEIVNAQDKVGDTALNIASRIGNKSIISQLIEVGADPNIANKAGLRPRDFGIGADAAEDGANGEAGSKEKNGTQGNSQRSRESSDDILTSITHLLNETSSGFQSELKTKQQAVDTLHASLRTTSAQLGEARRALEVMQASHKKQHFARQKVMNLERAADEEQYHLAQLEQMHGPAEEEDEAVDVTNPPLSAAVLRARIQAVRGTTEATRQMVGALQGRSRDVEAKYRRVVALCTGVPEREVDAVLEGLLRAVESEKDELEIGRVRRFLGGVDDQPEAAPGSTAAVGSFAGLGVVH